MNRVFPKLIQQTCLLSLILLVGAAGPAATMAAQLTTTWTDTSTNEDGFKIERKAGTTGTFAQVATVGANVTSYIDSSLTGGATYCYQVRAYNTAGDSAYSNSACGTASADTQLPVVSISAPASGSTVSGSSVTVSALASDNVGVVGVQFLLDGANLGSEVTAALYSITWNTTTVTNGTHNLTAVARDAAGNKTTSATVGVTVSNSVTPASNPTGLVAAYGFNEGSGNTVADASGNGNTGTLSSQTWTTGGKYGNALIFNANGAVDLGNGPSLQITSSITIEAWINPVSFPVDDSVIVSKLGAASPDLGFQLDTTIDTGPRTIRLKLFDPTGNGMFRTGQTTLVTGTWQHVAGVYDATAQTMHVYLNGVLDDGVLTGTVASSQQNSSQHGMIGKRPAGQTATEFSGTIDEVRIYNRALSASEIQTDMNTPVGTTPPPSQTFTLTVTKAGTGSGTVSSNPAGINCGATCSASYASGTSVTLTATPATGSTFTGWSGGCSGTATSCTVTLTAATSVTATFTPTSTTQNFTLTVNKGGTGSGTVSSNPAGINCGATCSASYASGTSVTLTATPATGSTFTGWSGGCSGTATSCTVTMNANVSVTATFTPTPTSTTQNFTLTVNKAGTGSGTVSSSPAGINCGATCSASYISGAPVILTATPATSSTFSGWSGGCSGTATTCTVTLTANTSIAATFTSQAVRIGVFRPSTGKWYLDINGNGLLDDCQIGGCLAPFGQQGNRPVVGDWTDTGTVQIGIFDPTAGLWKLDRNGNDLWDGCTVDLCLNFWSLSGNLPVAGRWTSTSSKDLIGVYSPNKKFWRLDLNGNGLLDSCPPDGCQTFGFLSGLPVVGDWTGTGTTKLGIFNASSSPGQQWKLDLNGNGIWDGCTVDACRGPFGISGDLPVAGDWTGTGKVRIGVFDPSTGLWDLDLNGNGIFDGCTVDACLGPFGQQGDLPVVGKW